MSDSVHVPTVTDRGCAQEPSNTHTLWARLVKDQFEKKIISRHLFPSSISKQLEGSACCTWVPCLRGVSFLSFSLLFLFVARSSCQRFIWPDWLGGTWLIACQEYGALLRKKPICLQILFPSPHVFCVWLNLKGVVTKNWISFGGACGGFIFDFSNCCYYPSFSFLYV